MIINLTTNKFSGDDKFPEDDNFNIKFNLPDIQFGDNDYVQVNEIAIFFKKTHPSRKNEKPIENLIGRIESSLIDKNPNNPEQQLIYFRQEKQTYQFLYSPTHIVKYKIQRQSLNTAEFKIHFCDTVKIEEIYLQIEITNGNPGIQSICSR